jgi:hypothetical protein
MRPEKKSWLFVIILSLIVTILNATAFIKGLILQPPNTVYMGMVHYFEDYFYYLNNFWQGAHGAWLVANRYTAEHTAPGFNYWLDLLMGKIGGVFGLSPVWSYNLWLILLVFVTLLASYILIRKFLPKQHFASVLAFLFALFATSMMRITNGRIDWFPVHEVSSDHYAFDRLTSVPRHTAEALLFYLLTLIVFTKPVSPFAIILIWLLTITNPVMGGVFIGVLLLYNVLARLKRLAAPTIPWSTILMLTAPAVMAYLYMSFIMTTPPHMQAKAWEATQQTYPSLMYFFLSAGPMYVLAAIGVIAYFIAPQPLILFCVILVVSTHLIYFSPIPAALGVVHGRFIFGALYPFIGILSVNGIRTIGLLVAKIIPWLKIKTIMLILFIIFFSLSLPTLAWEFTNKLSEGSPANPYKFLNYVPADEYRGFEYLSHKLPYDDATLGAYMSRTDLLVPALTGHTGYSGHAIETMNDPEKNRLNVAFFSMQMSVFEAQSWFKGNNIRYVVFTPADGSREVFESHYPFLERIFTNPAIAVYRL